MIYNVLGSTSPEAALRTLCQVEADIVCLQELNPQTAAAIQAARHDESIEADDIGYLDYKQAVIEWRKSSYEQYMAELRLKQTTGTLTDTERLILVGETGGWSDLNQLSDISTVMPTPPCVTPSTQIAYPQPGWLPFCGATPSPDQFPLEWAVPYRGLNPATLSPDNFTINIITVDIEGDVAKAIVSKSGVTSEMVLVKVDGQWYIAGGRLLNFSP